MNGRDIGMPIEQFIQALTTQLDHAQSAMAVKANNLNLPLTFAVKDIALDLRTHVEFVKSEVRIRAAGPGDAETSTLHLALTTITRPMIEENAPPADPDDRDEPPLRDVIDGLTDEEEKRLEWVGVRNVAQLRRVEETGNARAVERVASLPVERLRQALQRAAHPMVSEVLAEAADASRDAATLLRVRGRNLMRGAPPRVSIGGDPVPVVHATADELVVAPQPHQMRGTLVVETAAGRHAETRFDLKPLAIDGAADGELRNGDGAPDDDHGGETR
jgi:hypothetical protein